MVRSVPVNLVVSKHHSLVAPEYLEEMALEAVEHRVRVTADLRLNGDHTS
jgi:hypothetical protein